MLRRDDAFAVMNVLDAIGPLLNSDARPFRAVVLAPRIHAVHDMPRLRRVEDPSGDIGQGAYLLPRQRNRAIPVCPVGPAAFGADAVELVCEFLI